jgi:hypothetical protein
VIQMIPTLFWKELVTTPLNQRVQLANKYCLNVDERLQAGKIINEGKINEAFIQSVIQECKHSGLCGASSILEKYNVSGEDRELIKKELVEWSFSGEERNGTLFAKRLSKW